MFEFSAGARFNNNDTDVVLIQPIGSTGIMEEIKTYYSGENHRYGFKVEIFALPKGLAASHAKAFSESVADIEIFRRNSDWHTDHLKKTDSKTTFEDTGELLELYTST